MHFRDGFWERPREQEGGASAEAIAHAESQLGVNFPPEYVSLMARLDGGTPRRRKLFVISNKTKMGLEVFSIQTFLAISEVVAHYCPSTYDNWPDIRLIEFAADDDGNNWFCFDYRDRCRDPGIIYVTQEGEIEPVMPTFAEFISQLECDFTKDVFGIVDVADPDIIWRAIQKVLPLLWCPGQHAGKHATWRGNTITVNQHPEAIFYLSSNAGIRGYLQFPDHGNCKWLLLVDCELAHSSEVDEALKMCPFEVVEIHRLDRDKWNWT